MDNVSRKALINIIKNRLSKVPGYFGEATEIEDAFHRGKAISYENVIFDIENRIPNESEGEAAKLRTAMEELRSMEFASIGHSTWITEFIDQALSSTSETAVQQQEQFALSLSRKQLSNLVDRHGGNPSLKEMICAETDSVYKDEIVSADPVSGLKENDEVEHKVYGQGRLICISGDIAVVHFHEDQTADTSRARNVFLNELKLIPGIKDGRDTE